MKIPRLGNDLYSTKGLASYSIKSQLSNLLTKIEKHGLTPSDFYELRRLLHSLNLPHKIGICPIKGYYIMGLEKGNGIYKKYADPYIDCEILSGCIADAIFETMQYILKSVYGLRIKSKKYKWEIFNQSQKVGDMFYDMASGNIIRRMRASMTKKMIVICWRNEGFITKARIRFNPKGKRYIIRREVSSALNRKQKEFESILISKPRELFRDLITELNDD